MISTHLISSAASLRELRKTLDITEPGTNEFAIADTAIQQECEDDFRGRVFSVNDTSYNLCFVLGLFFAALMLPETGRSVPALLLVSAGYLVLTGWYWAAASRVAGRAHHQRHPVAV